MVEGTPRLGWRRLFIESLAVVASILAAFAIDAWWDGYQARRSEEDLLNGLLADFMTSRPSLEGRLELAERMARNSRLLAESLAVTEHDVPVAAPDSLLLALIGGPTYEANTDALDAAVASGEIELIGNPAIRSELAAWRRTLLDTAEDEIEVRRITNAQLVPLLAAEVDLAPYFGQLLSWSNGEAIVGLPGQAVMSFSSKLSGVLALRHFYVEFAAADLAQLLAILDEVVTLLEGELGR